MLFNTFGEPFYVFSTPIKLLSEIDVVIYPWWMDLLFAVAGISSAYALRKRSGKEYAGERVSKLLIPFLFGLLLVIPVQSFIADVFHNGYHGNYFEHYEVFFTKFTDLTGYDGGFTPGHTWFMLYLLIISMISIPVMLIYNKKCRKINGSKISMVLLLLMFIPILLMTPVLEIGGKSIGEALACFLLGFFILSLDEVLDKLAKYRISLAVTWILLMALRWVMFATEHFSGLVWDIQYRLLTWAGILAVLGLGKRYLNFDNRFTKYFSPAAFPLYFFHQSVLVIVAFFVVKLTNIIPVQILMIIILSFALTLLSYEIFRRFTATCLMFGIKKKSGSSKK
jgi:hypothetical protein